MKHKPMLIAVLFAALLVPGAAAQTNQTNATAGSAPTAPDGAPSDVQLVVDDDVAIVDWEYRDGAVHIEFYSTEYKSVSLWHQASADGGQGTIASRSVVVDEGKTTTVTVATTNRITVFTDQSLDAGRAVFVEKQGGGLMPSGPFDGTDVRDAAIGAAAGVALAVLLEAMKAKLGANEAGERVV